MTSRLLIAAARLWGALPGERLKTELVARLGQRLLVSVWAVIFDESGRVLLFRHHHDRAHPWGLPSGRLEGHETPEEAIQREFREEVNGILLPRRLVAALREPELPALRLVYWCDVKSPPSSISAEVGEWSYFSVSELPVAVRPLQRKAITAAKAESGGQSQPGECFV